MSDIFISYARTDRVRAQALAGALEQQGYSVWWDPHIPPGKTFDEVIEEALDNTKCVVVLWSKDSVKSDWVKSEAEEGKQRKILVPALIDKVKIPLAFRRIHAADLTKWQPNTPHSEFDSLLKAILEIVGPLPAREPEPAPVEPTPDETKRHREGTWYTGSRNQTLQRRHTGNQGGCAGNRRFGTCGCVLAECSRANSTSTSKATPNHQRS